MIYVCPEKLAQLESNVVYLRRGSGFVLRCQGKRPVCQVMADQGFLPECVEQPFPIRQLYKALGTDFKEQNFYAHFRSSNNEDVARDAHPAEARAIKIGLVRDAKSGWTDADSLALSERFAYSTYTRHHTPIKKDSKRVTKSWTLSVGGALDAFLSSYRAALHDWQSKSWHEFWELRQKLEDMGYETQQEGDDYLLLGEDKTAALHGMKLSLREPGTVHAVRTLLAIM